MMGKKGFTMVELLVTITIIALLSTIGFVGYSEYLISTRDGNRTAQVHAIGQGLVLHSVKKRLPYPNTQIEVTANGEVFAYQGYAGKDVLESIDFSDDGKDPKDDSYFSYMVTKDRKHFQLMTFLEEPSEEFIDYTNTAYSRFPMVYGKELGILTQSSTNLPVNEVVNLSLDIVNTTEEFTAHYSDSMHIQGSGSVLAQMNLRSSCQRLQMVGKKKNGIYSISPDGINDYEVYCNMKLGGGGWTLIATKANDGVNTWTYNNSSSLFDSTTIGTIKNKINDFKSQAYSEVRFKDVMFLDNNQKWMSADNVNPSYDQAMHDWLPSTHDCAYGAGRNFPANAGNISIDPTQASSLLFRKNPREKIIFFSIYDKGMNCDGSGGRHSLGPSWGFQGGGSTSLTLGFPTYPGEGGWGLSYTIPTTENGHALLQGRKNGVQTADSPLNPSGDYIMWFVR
ncbi:MAG: prepilin-type N-terminal cleavage/methylation domain-containing protein [Candidatus Gracilibacteria bacterium]|nr:prepilin-type N-terminal cleavage/methylation domain-containing protein [Candidatus Gracilibacteria bacterium]